VNGWRRETSSDYEIETAIGHWTGGRGGDLLCAGLHLHVAAGGEVLLKLASRPCASKLLRKQFTVN
jgi:hypothetical protein